MADKVIGSYLYELKPYINKEEWNKAAGDISSAINPAKLSRKEYQEMQNDLVSDVKQLAKLKGEQQRLESLRNKFKYGTDDYSKAQLRRIDELLEDEVTGIKPEITKLIDSSSIKKALIEENKDNIEKKTFKEFIGEANDKLSNFTSKLSIVTEGLKKLYDTFKYAIDKSMEIAEEASDLSNKLNAYGSFGSMNTRDMMTRYGISSTRANAMQNALSMMGLSETDIGRLSQAQRNTYNELIEYYEKGIDRIDTDKLKDFYNSMDEYQTAVSKWKINLETTKLKFFSESESFKKLLGSVERFFDNTIQFLNNPVVKFFMDTFLEFLSSLVDIASDIIGFIGGNSTTITTTNSNNTSTNNYYMYGSNYANSNNLARIVALEQQTGGIG